MIYLMRLKNGEQHEISQAERDPIVARLSGPKDERPEFIEIKSLGLFVSTAMIAGIERHKAEPERLPTPKEELAEFNREWDRGKP